MIEYILVNFGGPRHLGEIAPFLKELLCDRDVVRTNYPQLLHNWLFGRIAKKRARKIAPDYSLIGGRSPIFFDTEALAPALSERLKARVYTFHRYLPATHPSSLQDIERSKAQELFVLPLFPQFSYATTGSIARFFSRHLSKHRLLRWIRSYSKHPAYIAAFQQKMRCFLKECSLREEEVTLLFSAHGLPLSFIAEGDPYQRECEESFHAIREGFPNTLAQLAYQSKFGPEEWLRPYTSEACEKISSWAHGRSTVLVVPLSFTSDHIETLFEIEYQYLPLIRTQGLAAYRCPALNLEPFWIDALAEIARSSEELVGNKELIRSTYTRRDLARWV